MSDKQNDTTPEATSQRYRDMGEWTRHIGRDHLPALDFNYVQAFRMAYPSRPIIGYTEARQPQRFVWSWVCRVGHWLHERFARFEWHEGDGYDAPSEYWLKRGWRWLDAAGAKLSATLPQPIYDPDWTPPARQKMEWGFADLPKEPQA